MNETDSVKLAFHGLMPLWLAIIVGAAAAVYVFYLYTREHGRVGTGRRILMALLRVAVIATALFLLLRPVLVTETNDKRPRSVALLVDNSLSMSQQDQRLSAVDRLRVAIALNRLPLNTPVSDDVSPVEIPPDVPTNPSRAELLRAVLEHPEIKLEQNLRKVGPLQVYLFGRKLKDLPEDATARNPEDAPPEPLAERLAKSLTNDETRTALAEAISDVLIRTEGDHPAAIVALTDGRDNASKLSLAEAAEECRRLGVPLHLYGAGCSEVGNLELKDVAVPETLFYDDTVPVPVRWRCQGFREGTAEIVLTLGNKVVARREVALQPGEDLREVLTFTPQKTEEGQEERTELRASIRSKGEEIFMDDNELSRPVELVDRKVKILYIEHSPRWVYKFLMPALLRDRRVETQFLLTGADPRALAAGGPYLSEFPTERREIFEYDLLILGDVDAERIGTARLEWLRDFVREGGSLIFIAGRQHAPSSYADTPFAEVLPVEFTSRKPSTDDRERTEPFVPTLTRFGQRSEMLRLADTAEESEEIWSKLPGFNWFHPVTKLRPGAVALLVHPRRKTGERILPLLARHFYGKGQVLYMGTDETWRWRYNEENRYFGRFWGQVIYQMALPHLIGAPKRVQLALERPENVLGKPGHVYAQVFDPEYRPYEADHIMARLERLDAKPGEERSRSVRLDPVTAVPGEYRALLSNDTVGKFVLKVVDPAPARIEYRVGLPPEHELRVAGMNDEELRDAARVSGGGFYREEDLHKIAAAIRPGTIPFVDRREILLWNTPILLLFLALITLEWILRKLSDLS